MQNKDQYLIDLEDYIQILEWSLKKKDNRIAELEHKLMRIQQILQKAKQPAKVLHLDWSHVQVVELSKLNGVLAWWLAK